MRVLVVVVVLLLAGRARAETDVEVEVPPSWVEDPATAAAYLATTRDMPGTLSATASYWKEPKSKGASLALMTLVITVTGTAGETIDEIERAMKRSAEKGSIERAFERIDAANQVAITHDVEIGENRHNVRRYYALDAANQLHFVSLSCTERTAHAGASCDRILGSVRLTVAAVPLAPPANAPQKITMVTSSFEVPAGWTESKVNASELAALTKDEGMLRGDARQWDSPANDANLSVLEMDAKHDDVSTRALLEGIEDGIRNGIEGGKRLAYTRKTEHNQVVIDEVLELNGIRLHMRRHYAADAQDVVHLINATCNSIDAKPSPACEAALASLVIHVEAVPIGDGYAFIYRIAKLVGAGVVVVLLGIFIAGKLRKR